MPETFPSLNPSLRAWLQAGAAHFRPENIVVCDGSEAERERIQSAMVGDGTLIPLDPQTQPRSFLYRTDPSDVARTEHLTFICSDDRDDAGPTNNWMSPAEARTRVWPLFEGAMRGRTMYVVPYLLGPVGSIYSRVGVQITDSPYVVLSLRIMTRMGRVALQHLGAGDDFVRGIHSLGDLHPDRRFILHFPAEAEIWSIGSGYGGNALLSKKCHALRIESARARREGWLAEHMLILGITSPARVTHYVAAAFPSACGKTNLAMLVPTLPGWTIDTVGDDICWMHPGADGRLWAINPECGMFGVAPGTGPKTNPNAVRALRHDVIYTNVALRRGGRPWWEGLSKLEHGEVLDDWRGSPWVTGKASPAAHPNARFTVPLQQCPTASGTFDAPEGVPISAILFGGRRARVAPLIYEARNWAHGVYVGATLVSETTAAATGDVGVPRQDPMAMVPFCGYNMGDYFAHWLKVGKSLPRAPRIFHVNWFRTDASGRYLWPGFGDNIRVLQWIFDRLSGKASGQETPIGVVPRQEELDVEGLDLSPDRLRELLAVDREAWSQETRRVGEFLRSFGDRLPSALRNEQAVQVKRLLLAASHLN